MLEPEFLTNFNEKKPTDPDQTQKTPFSQGREHFLNFTKEPDAAAFTITSLARKEREMKLLQFYAQRTGLIYF